MDYCRHWVICHCNSCCSDSFQIQWLLYWVWCHGTNNHLHCNSLLLRIPSYADIFNAIEEIYCTLIEVLNSSKIQILLPRIKLIKWKKCSHLTFCILPAKTYFSAISHLWIRDPIHSSNHSNMEYHYNFNCSLWEYRSNSIKIWWATHVYWRLFDTSRELLLLHIQYLGGRDKFHNWLRTNSNDRALHTLLPWCHCTGFICDT